MTTAEKEKRVLDLGSPWTEVMKGLKFHCRTRGPENSDEYREVIALTRDDYYSNALSVILECARRTESKQPTANVR